MPAKSNHYGDVYNWIENIINSCDKKAQIQCVAYLIRGFEQKYLKRYKNGMSMASAIKDDKFNKFIKKACSDLIQKSVIKSESLNS